MKRDDELVRKILLQVEEQGGGPNGWISNFAIDGYSEDAVNYHVWLLGEAGLMIVYDCSTGDGDEFNPRCLTPAGHDFLATIRDGMIWKATVAAAKVSGAGTLQLLAAIAKAIARPQLKART